MSLNRIVPVCAIAIAPLACDTERSEPAAVVASDSAGVHIVSNTITHAPTCSLGETIFQIGSMEGPAAFERVNDVEMISDGSILVADQLAANVRVFDPRGGYLHSIGRAGSGPGEFRRILGLAVIDDTMFAVVDRYRLAYFTRAGRFTGYQVPDPPYLNAHFFSVFPDGTVVVATECCTPPGAGFTQRNLFVMVHDAARSGADTIARLQHRRLGLLAQSRPPVYVLPFFEPQADFGLMADSIVAANGRFPEFRIYNKRGQLGRLVRWIGSVRRITSEDVRRHREQVLATRARTAADTSFYRQVTGPEAGTQYRLSSARLAGRFIDWRGLGSGVPTADRHELPLARLFQVRPVHL